MSLAAQPLDGAGGVDLNIPVRAVNRSASPITWKYARVKYVLNPNVPTFVPYMAMCYYQGDPRSFDKPNGRAHEQYRRLERERLSTVHGVYEHHERWNTLPLIECFPIDSDVPFNTVLRDPDGTNMGEQTRDVAQSQFLQSQLEQMAAQMRVMQAQLAAQQQNEGALQAAGVPDPADLDRQATISKAVSPEEALGQSMVGQRPVKKIKTRPGKDEGSGVTVDE